MPELPDPRVLASQPEYFLNEVNLDAGTCGFLRLNRDAYRRSAFMDHRVKTESEEILSAPLTSVQHAIGELGTNDALSPINYILHTAFCCSTLISRCLGIEGACWALREPMVLMQMANYKRAGDRYHYGDADWRRLFDSVLFLLAKSRVNNEAVVIKPTNAANNLAADLVKHPRTGGVLLLHSSLEQFLVSIVKKGEAGRAFVRRLFNVIREDSTRTGSLPPAALMQLTDLQIAAFVWYQQMDVYLQLLARFPQANIRTLDCEVFLAQPETTLVKLCELFGIHADAESSRQVVAGPIFRKYSKNDMQDYDLALRQNEHTEVMQQHGIEIAGILSWSAGIRPEGPLHLPLPRAL